MIYCFCEACTKCCVLNLGMRNILTWQYSYNSDSSVGILYKKSRGSSAMQESPRAGAASYSSSVALFNV